MDSQLTKEQILEEIKNSLTIRRKSLYKWPDFGHRFGELRGCTEDTRGKAEAYAVETLQWMVDLGHLKSGSLEAVAEFDTSDEPRLHISVSAEMPTGEYVQFSRWVEVL